MAKEFHKDISCDVDLLEGFTRDGFKEEFLPFLDPGKDKIPKLYNAGDEFCVVFPNVHESKVLTICAHLHAMARRGVIRILGQIEFEDSLEVRECYEPSMAEKDHAESFTPYTEWAGDAILLDENGVPVDSEGEDDDDGDGGIFVRA